MTTRPTCFVVDDSDVVRKVMRTILEGISVLVDEIDDLDRALERCLETPPDVLVLDWHMPSGNSLDLVATLRAREKGRQDVRKPGVKILYVMTYLDPAEIAKAHAAGVDEILPKPFTRVQLEAKVLRLLSAPRAVDVDIEGHRRFMPQPII